MCEDSGTHSVGPSGFVFLTKGALFRPVFSNNASKCVNSVSFLVLAVFFCMALAAKQFKVAEVCQHCRILDVIRIDMALVVYDLPRRIQAKL